MSNYNILPSDRARVVGVVDPDAYGTGTETTGWVDASEFGTLLAIIFAGTLGASATLNAKIEEAEDGSGTNAQDLSGKAITALTKGAPDDSDKQSLINVRQDELSDGFTHVRLSLTVGTAASDAAGVLLGFDARYEPEDDASTVAEIVE